VAIANVSHKDITAYNLSVKETLADGSTGSSELMADYVGRIALVKEVQGTPDEAAIGKQFGDGLFHPGETREEMIGVQPGARTFKSSWTLLRTRTTQAKPLMSPHALGGPQ
jgi:hypothetical protein